MMRNIAPLFLICLFSNLLSAQNGAEGNAPLHPDRHVSPADVSMRQEAAEVEYFGLQLSLLKQAFEAKNASNIVVRESAVLMALRNEINQLELKLSADAAQTERRKTASSGQISAPANLGEAPARDPLADAVTPDEKRFETFQYTLAAFERHSFDPSKPEEAARDFAKLDKVLKVMQEALAELQAARR
jgi:hypothetical protein